jgi:hypothetical protein
MGVQRFLSVKLLAVGVALMARPGWLRADAVGLTKLESLATTDTGLSTVQAGAGTGGFNLYSNQVGGEFNGRVFPAVGPNKQISTVVPTGAKALKVVSENRGPGITLIQATENENVQIQGKDKLEYGPPILLVNNIPKPPANSMYSVTSTSGIYSATGSMVNNPAGYYPSGTVGQGAKFTQYVQANAYINNVNQDNRGNLGQAAALGGDPVFIPAVGVGSSGYAYEPDVSVAMQATGPGSFAQAVVYAADNTVYPFKTDFVQAGSPYSSTLWYLSLSNTTVISSTSDVDVSFYLNPLALNEISLPAGWVQSLPGYLSYVAGLPGYTPGMALTNAQTALFLNSAIASEMSGELAIDSNDVVTLNTDDLFPEGTTYTPGLSGGTYFADGSIAGIEMVPAPVSVRGIAALLGMLASARAVCGMIRGRKATGV